MNIFPRSGAGIGLSLLLLAAVVVAQPAGAQTVSPTPISFQASVAAGQTTNAPQAQISNNAIKAQIYLPDREKGFYRGTRFDWSGVIGSLVCAGHNYYGPWFTKADPTVNDFVYDGADIVAGPCSAATGPVEEFSTDGKALGYDQAPPGGTFIKIGVGVLRKPKEGGAYSAYRLYDIVDAGSREVRTTRDSIQFVHNLADPTSGFGYRYEKTIRLVQGQPKMVMEHRLKNTGKLPLKTSVYNHNFLVLDAQPPGPDFMLKMPFEVKTARPADGALAEARGQQIVYKKVFQDRDVVYTRFEGFGTSADDYQFTIENKKVGAGMTITGDRPLSSAALWSIRSVMSIEPFVTMTVDPARDFSWKYTYRYYPLDGRGK